MERSADGFAQNNSIAFQIFFFLLCGKDAQHYGCTTDRAARDGEL